MVVFMFNLRFQFLAKGCAHFVCLASVATMAQVAIPANCHWDRECGAVPNRLRQSAFLARSRRVARGFGGNKESPLPELPVDRIRVRRWQVAEADGLPRC